MKRIVLISCVSQKLNHQAKAKDLYVSALFRKSLKYAFTLNPDKIFILSAKYHLLSLDQVVEPYDLTLRQMRLNEVKAWANIVIKELRKEVSLDSDEVIFLAGEKYRRFLIPEIKSYKVPMEGLGIGKQLRFLTNT